MLRVSSSNAQVAPVGHTDVVRRRPVAHRHVAEIRLFDDKLAVPDNRKLIGEKVRSGKTKSTFSDEAFCPQDSDSYQRRQSRRLGVFVH
jgi:hypothetical protein